MEELRTFESYATMQKVHQQEVNKFPFIWVFAFSEDEFVKKMAEEIKKRKPACTGITTMKGVEKHVTSIGAGGFIFKEDMSAMNKMFSLHTRERVLFEQNLNHLAEAIESEMWNHEYGYTGDKYDTLLALGRSYKDLETDDTFARAWKKAEKKVNAWCAEH